MDKELVDYFNNEEVQKTVSIIASQVFQAFDTNWFTEKDLEFRFQDMSAEKANDVIGSLVFCGFAIKNEKKDYIRYRISKNYINLIQE